MLLTHPQHAPQNELNVRSLFEREVHDLHILHFIVVGTIDDDAFYHPRRHRHKDDCE